MAIENATYISQLNPAYPAGGEPVAQGDDHLRMIKQVLKNTFPTIGAAMNAAGIPASPYGNTPGTNVQDQLNQKLPLAGGTMSSHIWFNDGCGLVGLADLILYGSQNALIRLSVGSSGIGLNPNRLNIPIHCGSDITLHPVSGSGEGANMVFNSVGDNAGVGLIDIDNANSFRFLNMSPYGEAVRLGTSSSGGGPLLVMTNGSDRFRFCQNGNLCWTDGPAEIGNPEWCYKFFAVGDFDTGIGWGGDGHLLMHCNGQMRMHIEAGQDGIWVMGNNEGGEIRLINPAKNNWCTIDYSAGNLRLIASNGATATSFASDGKVNSPLEFGGYSGTNSTSLFFDGPGFGRVGEIVGVHVGGQYTAIGFTATQNNQNFQMRNDGKGYAPAGWATFCDKRLKSNIQPITGALEKLSLIGGYTFRRDSSDTVGAGVLAQEVQLAIPEAISYYDPETMAVEPFAVIGLLVEAVKELKAEVTLLKAQAC